MKSAGVRNVYIPEVVLLVNDNDTSFFVDRALYRFWRSSSVQRLKQSFLFWWMFFTVLSCCFQKLLNYVKVEHSCPSKPLSVICGETAHTWLSFKIPELKFSKKDG